MYLKKKTHFSRAVY